jgi:hypothetical protein
MGDLRAAKVLSHRRNIERYSRLLATGITELEREYLRKQIAEEQAELERWAMQSVPDPLEEASKGIAAQKSDNRDKESRA